MGLVYKAIDRRLGRTVAIKFLRRDLVGVEDAVRRFECEAKTVSALNHPHIATLYDVGWANGQPYLVFEFLPGGTVAERIAGVRLPFELILAYSHQIGGGLEFAHKEGVVHRDLKPGNVMFASTGSLKIVDFGLSKFWRLASATAANTRMGTIAYMAPEQARGDPVDHRADIFSLGVMLYEFAAGRRPFSADHPEAVIHQILNAAPPRLDSVRPELPGSFPAAVEKALSKDPGQRQQSAAELLHEFDPSADMPVRVSSTMDTVSLTPKPPMRAIKGFPRKRIAALAVSAAVSIGGIVAVSHWAPWRPTMPERRQLAVLAFESLGDNPADRAFCDGLTESLTGSLSRTEEFQQALWVVPESELRSAHVKSIRDARTAFNVNLAITGSVQRTESQIRVTVNLSDAAAIRQLDSRTIPVSRGNSPELEPALWSEAADMLKFQLQRRDRGRLGPSRPPKPEAYVLETEGQGLLQRGDEGQSLEQAIERFEKAIQIDPQYAAAHAALATAYFRRYRRTHDQQWLARADTEAQKALALNDGLPEAHIAQGLVRAATGQSADALQQFKRALALDRTNVEARRQMALALETSGRTSEAAEVYQEAIRLRPGYWPAYGSLGSFYFNHGDYRRAEEAMRMVVELAPANVTGYRNLGAAYLAMGSYDKAEAILRKGIGLKEDDLAYSNLGIVYFSTRRYREAADMFRKAVDIRPGNAVNWGNLGDAWAQVDGAKEKSIAAFRKGLDAGSRELALNPRNARLRSTMAVFQAKLGDSKAAQENVLAALRIEPENVTILYKAARVYEICGHRTVAIRYLREALKRNYSVKDAMQDPDLARLREDPKVRALFPSANAQ